MSVKLYLEVQVNIKLSSRAAWIFTFMFGFPVEGNWNQVTPNGNSHTFELHNFSGVKQ